MNKTTHRRPPRGFTLVEMLITVAVIGIIAAMALGAMSAAQESARRSRTQALIAKLHGQLMYRWESYQTRRLPMAPRGASELPAVFVNRRLSAIRELMRLELPQRWEDVTSTPIDQIASGAAEITPISLGELPALSEAYLHRLNGIRNTVSPNFQSAECLYMIVTMGHDDGLGTQRFHPRDVGDADGDGAPEFVDGWGRPISFLRWAPGYLPASALPADQGEQAADTNLHTGDPIKDHDPFDPLQRDMPTGRTPRGFRLMPLIYSSGPDGESDIWAATAGLNSTELNDPYFVPPNGRGLRSGTPMTAANSSNLPVQGEGRHVDNITNHALGVR